MTQRRHGLELREGRWCNQRDLERLRREAAEGDIADLKRYLKGQERCGGLPKDIPMVMQYIQTLIPSNLAQSVDWRAINYGYTMFLRPKEDLLFLLAAFPEYRFKGRWAEEPEIKFHHQATAGLPSRLRLESWFESWGMEHRISAVTVSNISVLSKWLSKQFKLFQRIARNFRPLQI